MMRLDGRNSRLHLEHQLRLQLEQEWVATGAAVAQDTQRCEILGHLSWRAASVFESAFRKDLVGSVQRRADP